MISCDLSSFIANNCYRSYMYNCYISIEPESFAANLLMFHISPNKMDRVGYSTMFMFIRRPIDKYALETHNSFESLAW